MANDTSSYARQGQELQLTQKVAASLAEDLRIAIELIEDPTPAHGRAYEKSKTARVSKGLDNLVGQVLQGQKKKTETNRRLTAAAVLPPTN